MSSRCGWTSFFSLPVLSISMVLLMVSAVSSTATLEEDGIEIKYNISRHAELVCTIKDLGERRIIWRRLSDSYPISVGGFRFASSRKYRVKTRGDTSTLVIKRVSLADAAEYMCEASGGAGPTETIILNIQAGKDMTYLLPKPTTITTDFGQTVILPCHVENMEVKHAVLWKDSNNQVLSIRKKELLHDRRFRVQHRTRTEWSLQIKKVREDDLGFYTCIVNTEPVLTRTVELRHSEPARVAPVIMQDNSYKQRVVAETGETVTLNCSFKAYPEPVITWYKREPNAEGKMVKNKVGEGRSYTLRSVSLSEAGDYVCIGDNGVGNPGKAKMKLIVNAPPTPATTTKIVPTGPTAPRVYHHVDSTVTARRGRSAYLECEAVGQPRPRIDWKRKGGNRIEKNSKFGITTTMGGEHTTLSKLEIRSLVNKDFGEYECHGHNALGLDTITFQLVKQ